MDCCIADLWSIIAFFAFLVLFFLAEIWEHSFSKIPVNYLETLEKPSPNDYRVDQFLDEPASLYVSFSLLKYLSVIGSSLVLFLFFNLTPGKLTDSYEISFKAIAYLILIFVFGELLPLLFKNTSPSTTFKTSFPIIIPLTSLIELLKFIFPSSLSKYGKRLSRKETISISEISEVIENSADEPEEEAEKRLLKGVISFSDMEVKEVMRSRMDVVSFSIHTPFEELLRQMIDAGYSRFPVYDKSLDDIKGILYIKDILPHLTDRGEFNWQSTLRKPLIVPENMKITQVLAEFQKRKNHMAVVVDEYGGTNGIATLEDVLEEIVGEIDDEHDTDSDSLFAQQTGDNTYVCDGKISIVDFIRLTQVPEDDFKEMENEAETLAGVVLNILGAFPQKNDQVQYKNYTFTVLSIDERRIKMIKTEIHEKKDEE